MGRYLDLVREIAGNEPISENLKKPEIKNVNVHQLKKAGWRSKDSFGGVVIWERPDTGCYVSEEMAMHLLESADRVRYVVNRKNRMGWSKQRN